LGGLTAWSATGFAVREAGRFRVCVPAALRSHRAQLSMCLGHEQHIQTSATKNATTKTKNAYEPINSNDAMHPLVTLTHRCVKLYD
jgi:hypothetical protein